MGCLPPSVSYHMAIINLLPDSYDNFYKLFAIIAIALGGLWAITKWIHQEQIRKQKEVPGFQAELSFTQVPLSKDMILLTIDVITMNTGDVPIRPEIQKAFISVKATEVKSLARFIQKDVKAKPDETFLLAPDLSELCLEPRTQTVFSAFYIAKPKTLYSVHFNLPAKHCTSDGKPWSWHKWRLFYTSDHRHA